MQIADACTYAVCLYCLEYMGWNEDNSAQVPNGERGREQAGSAHAQPLCIRKSQNCPR
jgi:hypothetical protein